ncbi:MAG: hypothetical protein K2M64_03705 [Clostridia bacterium]|nr:hypothetical protein [Clostridia bacterium]
MAHVNDGHRQRLRERMLKEGLDGFQDHEILELLLFQSVPRKDTNKLAHTLIASFGSLYNVLSADPDELMLVNGVSQVTACNLSMLKEVWRRYKKEENEKISLTDIPEILKYARLMVGESYSERVIVVYVDRGTKFLFSNEFASTEDTHSVNVDIKKVVSTAVRVKASGIILFHCHVQGNCEPSADDLEFTQRLVYALSGLEIVLLEHMIFNAEGNYYSFFEYKVIDKMIEELNLKIN